VKTVPLVLVIVGTTLVARAGVEEKKQRDSVDEAAGKAAGDIKDCGKAFRVVFDWKSFDAIDWNGIKREKREYYSSEKNNLNELGTGLNKLCADKDYKAALVKINTIVYRSTNNDTIRVKATVSAGTLTLDNYSFGSTRNAWDYESAAKAAL
jgi:transposase